MVVVLLTPFFDKGISDIGDYLGYKLLPIYSACHLCTVCQYVLQCKCFTCLVVPSRKQDNFQQNGRHLWGFGNGYESLFVFTMKDCMKCLAVLLGGSLFWPF